MRHPAAFTFTASRYLPPLTGIRAPAALLVLAMHTEQNVPGVVEAILASSPADGQLQESLIGPP
jgi:peptidoglycan/LPS O-acetylase OafA/YrhL